MKTWFITGTSRGFGREWAIAALERGDKVAATARNLASLDDLVAKHADAILPIALDVTDRDADFAAVKRAHEHFGRLDIIVNNAGYGHFGMVEEVSEAEIRAQLETNVLGALWVTQAALPYLREQGSGHILQVSSIGGISAFMNTGAYHASKWALEGFSQSLAQEVAEFGVKVTLIEPAGYSTDWSGSSAKHSAELPAYDKIREQALASRKARFTKPPRTRRSAFSSASHRWGSRPPTTTRGWPPGGNGSRWPPPPRASAKIRQIKPVISNGPGRLHSAQFPSMG
jgi:NAD(P)-dependent dehydrogenase (short-subunit alcohol dehydrogenase family)